MAFKIALDVGHTPASVNGNAALGYLEYYQMLSYAKLIKANLDNYAEIDCVIFDEPTASASTELSTVVTQINNWGADYVISLHSNAASDSSARGIETYSYDLINTGFKFATKINTALFNLMSSKDSGFKNRGVKTGSQFYVVNSTKAPAILIEFGFHTNTADVELMTKYEAEIAESLAEGVIEFMGITEQKTEHWAKAHLDSLFDKGIITDKSTWSNFDASVDTLTVGLLLALFDKGTN